MIDGDDATLQAQTPTERVGNHLQIFNGTVGVSRRANIVKKAGRATEMKYLRGKKMLEMKRDIEAMVLSSQAAIAATTSIAGQSAGLGTQLYLNTSHGAGGSTAAWTSGAALTAPTAGTARAFAKTQLDAVCQSIYTNSGAFAEMVVVSPSHKVGFSAFTGIAQNRFEVKGKQQGAVVGGADVYMSDFGALTIVPHYLLVGSTNAYVLNTDYLDLAFLDGFVEQDLAKTGDSEKILITADCALTVRASAAQGKIADLTP
jgi:hypothetical protein